MPFLGWFLDWSCRRDSKLLPLWSNSSIPASSGWIITCLRLSESLAASAWKRRDVLFIQKSLIIDSTLSDSWRFAGSQTARQSEVICHGGLAGLHPFSGSLAECLRLWLDCQSYLSQLGLAIRLAAPSVAFSFCCPRQMVPVQPLIYSFY